MYAIRSYYDEPVVRPRPDDAPLDRRLGDGKQHRPVSRARVVGGEAARLLLLGLVVRGEVRADHVPRLPAVAGSYNFV